MPGESPKPTQNRNESPRPGERDSVVLNPIYGLDSNRVVESVRTYAVGQLDSHPLALQPEKLSRRRRGVIDDEIGSGAVVREEPEKLLVTHLGQVRSGITPGHGEGPLDGRVARGSRRCFGGGKSTQPQEREDDQPDGQGAPAKYVYAAAAGLRSVWRSGPPRCNHP